MRNLITGLIFACLSSQFGLAQSGIYINEFLASNISSNADMVDYGDYSDWIELYNDQSIPANIGGFYITDDLTNPTKWQIPANTTIDANGYLILWADGFDDIPGNNYIRDWWPDNIPFTTQYLHTNFKLDKDGEEIALYNDQGVLIDYLQFTHQVEDVSYGRQPDGTDNWFYFGEPTPEASNLTEGVSTTEFSKDVLFSVSGGFFSGPQSISLTSTSGTGTIRYTLDHSTPSSNSTTYTTPISISENTTITARVFNEGKLPGEIYSKTYLFESERNLPAFSISTDYKYLMAPGTGIYRNTLKEREIPVHLEFHPLQGESFSMRTGMRIGGENIYRFAQKPLNIYARGNYGESEIEYPIFDHLPFQAYKRLYLRNSGDDWPDTMIRDGMISSLLRGQIDNSTQAYRPSVLYLNGEYWGIYNLREKLDKQYFSLHYGTAEADLDHLEANTTVIEGSNEEYLNLLNYVGNNPSPSPAIYENLSSQIDIHNLMDFVIVQTYLANSSWSHNREIWKDRGNDNLWRWVLVDMDRGFNTNRIASNQIDDINSRFELFQFLMKNEGFKNEFVQRFSERLNTTFKPTRVISVIDSLQDQIEPEMPRHIEKWGTYIDSLSIDQWGQTAGISSMTSWNSEIESFRTFALQRPAFTIQHMASEFGLQNQATLKVTSNLNNLGKVDLNGFFKNAGFEGNYFTGIPMKLKAYAPPGYRFKSWSLIQSPESTITVIPSGSLWNYNDSPDYPGDSWKAIEYDDSWWKSGNGVLGYGDNQATIIEYGPDGNNKNITAYFRHDFELNNAPDIIDATLKLLRDDGAVVYVNGVEVVRSNMPEGEISYTTTALDAIGSSDEDSYFDFNIPTDLFFNGTNTIAVEVHQVNSTSSDLSFDLSLGIDVNSSTEPLPVTFSTSEEIEFTLQGDSELRIELVEAQTNFVPATIDQNTTLTTLNSPYIVNENIHVNSNATLLIEPGVELKLNEGTGIYVQGNLKISGTEDSPVSMSPYYPGKHFTGVFLNNAEGLSEFEYLRIEDATGVNNDDNFFAAISTLNSKLVLNHVILNNVRLPVSSQNSDLRIENSQISNVYQIGDYLNVNGGNLWVINNTFEGNNIEDMDAIDIGYMSDSTLISGNIFRNFVGDNTDAVDIGDASTGVVVINNKMLNCGDKAVSVGQGSEAYIAYNVIADCKLGVGIKDEGSFAEVANNTFYHTEIGVAAYEKVLNRGGGSAVVKNSLFIDSQEAPVSADEFSSVEVSYSLSDTDPIPGLNNLNMNAELINPVAYNFYPQYVAIVLNSGNPMSPLNDDGSRAHIGALGFRGSADSPVIINEINYHSSDTFNPEDWVEFYNSTYQSLDISGWVFTDASKEQTYTFDQNSIISQYEFVVIARDSFLFSTHFPEVSFWPGDMETGLSGSGESLFLYNNEGYLVDSLSYIDNSPWPASADGDGPTLELISPEMDNGLASSWVASVNHGTPGFINSKSPVQNEEPNSDLPDRFILNQNYPNPFNPETIISYELPTDSNVELKVYDMLGREVITLVSGLKKAGYHQITLKAESLASGMYIYQLRTGNQVFTKKLMLIK